MPTACPTQNGQETVFFDSSTIGGDRSSAAGLGLHEATESMGEYFRLGTLTPGEKGMVTLSVTLDGETQGNDYQNTLADLTMSFAVDTLNPTADDGDGNPENPDFRLHLFYRRQTAGDGRRPPLLFHRRRENRRFQQSGPLVLHCFCKRSAAADSGAVGN